MNFTCGRNLRLTLFGESHGALVGVTADGLPAGIPVDESRMQAWLDLRRAYGDLSTARREEDAPRVVTGVFEGRTDGGPLTILIDNKAQRSGDYPERVFRPSHADYTACAKLGGYNDYRGGGSFSGRMTAPLAALGGLLSACLESSGVTVGTHISQCGDVRDEDFSEELTELAQQVRDMAGKRFAVLNEERGEEMQALIREAREDGDSVGGVLETAVCGLPAGVGAPYFDSLEGVLSHLLFSIPGVKGVEFGLGFGFGYLRGSEVNDMLTSEDGKVLTKSNFSGGINGGISNGMPVVFRTAFRPTPSISKKQQTVDPQTLEEKELELRGRHDPAIFHRARVVVDAMTVIGLFDLMLERDRDVWTGSL